MSEPDDDVVRRVHTETVAVPDGYRVILTGELDALTSPAVAALLETAAGAGPNLGVDVAQISFCDLAGLRMLLRAHRVAAERGAVLSLCHPPPHLRWLLNTTGAARVLLAGDPADDEFDEPPLPAGAADERDRAADARDNRADAREHRADARERQADARERRADARERRADDRELLEQARGRLLDDRAREVREEQRWQDIREDLANKRDREKPED